MQTEPEGTGGQEKRSFVYLLRCADGSLYCGWTTDPEKRLAAHNSGRGAKYTRSRGPCRLVYTEAFATKGEALKRECAIKKLTHAEKERLVLLKEENGNG